MSKLQIKGCLLRLIWSDGAVNEVTIPQHLRTLIDDYCDELEVERNLNEL